MVPGKAPVSSRTAEVPQEHSDTLSHGHSATIAAIATGALAMVLVLTVAAYAYLGRFTRYVADDYTRKNDLRVRGFWASQVWEYLHWTGRFVSIAVIDGGLLLNEVFVRLLPGLLLLLWVLAICAAAKALVPTIGLVGRITLALAVVVTTVEITPNPFLSLYWMSGSLAYIPCLLLGAAFVALAASRRAPGVIRIAAAGLLTLLAGGFNEGYAVAQLTLLLLALAATWVTALPALRRSRSVLVSGCAGSVLSLVILGAAPGNGVRFGVISEIIRTRPSLLALPGVTIGFAAQFLNDVFVARWVAVLAAGAMVALVAARTPVTSPMSARRGFLMVVSAVFAALIALVGSFASTAYVEARITPIYAQIVPVFIGVCAVAVVGWGCGRYVRSWCARISRDAGNSTRWRSVAMASSVVAVAGLAAAVPVQSLIGIWDDRDAFSAYAAAKDTQAALAQSAGLAGRPSVVVPATSAISNLGVFSHSGFEEMLADPGWWINKGEATYYGVGSISAQG
jgi:hypothetical protein